MNLADRLRVALQHANKSQSQVAAEIGVSTSAVSQWMTGSVQGLRAGTASALEKATGCRAEWLVTGNGPKFVDDTQGVALAQTGTRPVPLVSYVQAGQWKGGAQPFEANEAQDWLLTDANLSDAAFALEIKGESMLPDYRPGDRVIIDPSVAPQPGDCVVAKNGDDEATFKKYRPRAMDARGSMVFELVPLNDDYPIIRSDVTPVRIVGTMVEHRKYRRR